MKLQQMISLKAVQVVLELKPNLNIRAKHESLFICVKLDCCLSDKTIVDIVCLWCVNPDLPKPRQADERFD